MFTKIDALTGQGLMRLWGVPSFPLVEGDHLLWNGVGVFFCMDFGDHVDLHMAMKPGERHRCRDAVSEVLERIGDREIHAPIRVEHKQVCNLARKFDFKYEGTVIMEFLDGSIGNVIIMKRGAK
ncbi:hypothetical protein FP371_24800 [Citrobacter freundii]|uniref:hypothetical protein n=1 Tax=Citrobacter freundii TaxID=546 RepID=UPI001BCD0EC3|nr:hypothetical protein [Citrobacter freundii]MBY5301427.1 hypothetical protein [Citrobacter freundii]